MRFITSLSIFGWASVVCGAAINQATMNDTNLFGESVSPEIVKSELPTPSELELSPDQLFSEKKDLFGSTSYFIANAEPSDFAEVIHNYAVYLRRVKHATQDELAQHQAQWLQELSNITFFEKDSNNLSKRNADPASFSRYHGSKVIEWTRNAVKDVRAKVKLLRSGVLHGAFKSDCKYIAKNLRYASKRSKASNTNDAIMKRDLSEHLSVTQYYILMKIGLIVSVTLISVVLLPLKLVTLAAELLLSVIAAVCGLMLELIYIF